jgi:hypothetical protein
MTFCCERCNKSFRDNGNLKKHRERKIPCKQIIPIILQPEQKFVIYLKESLLLGDQNFDHAIAVKWLFDLHNDEIRKNKVNHDHDF